MAAPDFGQISEGLRRSTVSFTSQHQGQRGHGSGVIWSAGGLIVTNAHVVRAGELVIAAGNPLGFNGALSTGVVHRVGPFQGMGQFSWVREVVVQLPAIQQVAA